MLKITMTMTNILIMKIMKINKKHSNVRKMLEKQTKKSLLEIVGSYTLQ